MTPVKACVQFVHYLFVCLSNGATMNGFSQNLQEMVLVMRVPTVNKYPLPLYA